MDYFALRTLLWQERADYSLNPPTPRCEVCNKPLWGGRGQCHHVIRRGIVQGWRKRLRHLINSKYNCLLTCSEQCHRELHADPARAVEMLVKRYGREEIERWVNSLPFRVPYDWSKGEI